MEPEMECRLMNERDIEPVEIIEKEAFPDPWSAKSFLESLALECTVMNVAETDGEVAGYAVAYLSIDEAEITKAAVDAAYRRRGIAEALLADLIRRCEDRGARNFVLEVRSRNSAAISLYEKTGFRPLGTRKHFYENPADDAVIMSFRRD